jgi:hypothetical protein
VIKQKIESHNNFVIFDKHFLNLMWNDLVQSFVFHDKIKYFVIFYATLLSDQWFMCFVSNQTRLMFSDIFSNIMSMKTIEYDVFARIKTKNISMTNLTIIVLNTTLNKNQSCQKHRSKMKSSNVWDKFSCQWSTSCSKTSIWTTNDESS